MGQALVVVSSAKLSDLCYPRYLHSIWQAVRSITSIGSPVFNGSRSFTKVLLLGRKSLFRKWVDLSEEKRGTHRFTFFCIRYTRLHLSGGSFDLVVPPPGALHDASRLSERRIPCQVSIYK